MNNCVETTLRVPRQDTDQTHSLPVLTPAPPTKSVKYSDRITHMQIHEHRNTQLDEE